MSQPSGDHAIAGAQLESHNHSHWPHLHLLHHGDHQHDHEAPPKACDPILLMDNEAPVRDAGHEANVKGSAGAINETKQSGRRLSTPPRQGIHLSEHHQRMQPRLEPSLHSGRVHQDGPRLSPVEMPQQASSPSRPGAAPEGMSTLDALWTRWTGHPDHTNGHADSQSLLGSVQNSLNDFFADDDTVNGTPEPRLPSEFKKLKQKAAQSVKQLQTLLAAIRAPLPTETGDGSSLPPVPSQDALHNIAAILQDLKALGVRRAADLVIVAQKMGNHELLDDREYYMEKLTRAAAVLPSGKMQKKISDTFLTALWNDLEHPPKTLLGNNVMSKVQESDVNAGKTPSEFRMPDGSHNNYLYPHVGAAGMPYARTVNPMTSPAGNLPDPGVLFDTVMARKDPKGQEHPNRISSMLFSFASIVIHDIFHTSHDDYNISETSSYLDLAPLYGSTWAQQKRMRTLKNGKIHPDCFSDTRLLALPPGVGALLILFNRYHNYVVEQLALINENGRFAEDLDPKKRSVERYGDTVDKRDDDLFQTARLITCGLYVNVVLVDYVRTILNLNRTDDNWRLDPRSEIANLPKAAGNQVSSEFNLVYRWHSAISTKDDAWTQELMKEMFPGMDPHQAGDPKVLFSFLKQLGKMDEKSISQEPWEREFPALKSERLTRIPEGPFKGNFKDDDLADILTASIEDCANAYGPQQVPTVLKPIEILGIMQARTWRVATLNEMRKHFNLKPYREIDEITSNEEVRAALKHLYGTADNVELYPGLVVEDAKDPWRPGSGLCPGYTISRGVLSDAVALVRGDRYYTTSYTPAALTSWGFKEASSDLTIDNGCVLYKLFLRALPNNYHPASVYVHYPMTVPHGKNGMQEVLERLGKADKYNFDQPKSMPQPTMIFSYKAANEILNNQKDFHVTWGWAIEFLMGKPGRNFMLAGDGKKNADSRKLMEKALYMGGSARQVPKGDEKWLKAVRDFYEETTTRLLKEKSCQLQPGQSTVDIIRDVGNLAHVHFGAELFGLPLKTEKFPRGIFTEQQMYLIMAAVFICVFFDVDPPKSFPLRQQAYEATQAVGQIVQLMVIALKKTENLPSWITAEQVMSLIMPASTPLREYGVHMIARLVEADPDVADLVWGNIMGTCGGMVANQGQLFGQVLDFFLCNERGLHEYWPQVQALARRSDAVAFDELQHWLMEAARLNGETGVFRDVQNDVSITDQTGIAQLPVEHKLKKGDRIMVNLKAASVDPQKWGPTPGEVNLKNRFEDYVFLGHGAHQCLGWNMTRVGLTTMLRVIARLEGLQPARVSLGGHVATPQGAPIVSSVKKVLKEFVPGDSAVLPESWHYHLFMTEDWDMYFPFPTSLKVTYNTPAAEPK